MKSLTKTLQTGFVVASTMFSFAACGVHAPATSAVKDGAAAYELIWASAPPELAPVVVARVYCPDASGQARVAFANFATPVATFTANVTISATQVVVSGPGFTLTVNTTTSDAEAPFDYPMAVQFDAGSDLATAYGVTSAHIAAEMYNPAYPDLRGADNALATCAGGGR